MKEFDPKHYNDIVQMLYQGLVLLISLILIAAIGTLGYVAWGDAIAGWWKKETLVVADSSSRSKSASMEEEEEDQIENGIHMPTGLVVAEGFEQVRATCTACHSAKLVTQNRATRQGWKEMIRWMQETQGLWQLGEQEDVILDYLAANYAPQETGRRANLDLEAIEWYVLERTE